MNPWGALYGAVMATIAGIIILVSIVPFIGITWFISLFNLISDSLLSTFHLSHSWLVDVFLWLGIIGAWIVSIIVAIFIFVGIILFLTAITDFLWGAKTGNV